MRRACLLAFVVALLGSSCSSDSTTPVAPTTTTVPSPLTEAFTSGVVPAGASSHTFVAATAGTVDITLTTSGPPTSVSLGVGIGIPTTTSSGCSLTTAVNTVPGSTPQLAAVPVDAGRFCVKVFDPGTPLTQEAFFTVTITHP